MGSNRDRDRSLLAYAYKQLCNKAKPRFVSFCNERTKNSLVTFYSPSCRFSNSFMRNRVCKIQSALFRTDTILLIIDANALALCASDSDQYCLLLRRKLLWKQQSSARSFAKCGYPYIL